MRFILLAVLLTACQPSKRPTYPQPSTQEVLLSEALDSTVALKEVNIFCTGSFIQGDSVLTAHHCVNDREIVSIETRDGRTYEYKVVKRDSVHDLALLVPQEVISPHKAFHLASEMPSRGARVVLIGHPFGVPWSFFPGRLNNPSQTGFSGIGEDEWFMYDSAGGPGSSGGPVLNEYGELIGVNLWHPIRGNPGWRAACRLDRIKKFLGAN